MVDLAGYSYYSTRPALFVGMSWMDRQFLEWRMIMMAICSWSVASKGMTPKTGTSLAWVT
jgi:hypothetical protein